jgi:hypothetical protein
MSTPRELLLARHRRAARRIETARRRALLEALPRSEALWWRLALEELFAPQRAFWAALAALWILMLGFQLATRPAGGSMRPPTFAETPGPATDGFDHALLAQLGLPTSDSTLLR